MKVLVTGAAGFIAFHLIESLLHEGVSVVGIDNFDKFYDKNLKLQNLKDLESIALKLKANFTFLERDFCNSESLHDLPKGITAVIHLGAKAGVRPSIVDPVAYINSNIVGTQVLLDWARDRQVRSFIFGSSSSVYGNSATVPFSESDRVDHPISPYAATKRSCELLCSTYSHLYDLKISALRFFTVYGPRQRPDLAIRHFTSKIFAGLPISLFGDGKTARDYTFVTDIVFGIKQALAYTVKKEESFFEIFNLGGHQTTTLIDLVGKIENFAGKKAVIEWCPVQPGDVVRTYADISKSAQMLEYKPQVDIDEGLSLFVSWYKETYKY